MSAEKLVTELAAKLKGQASEINIQTQNALKYEATRSQLLLTLVGCQNHTGGHRLTEAPKAVGVSHPRRIPPASVPELGVEKQNEPSKVNSKIAVWVR